MIRITDELVTVVMARSRVGAWPLLIELLRNGQVGPSQARGKLRDLIRSQEFASLAGVGSDVARRREQNPRDPKAQLNP